MAIAATAPKAALSSLTPSGIGTARSPGTTCISACPAEAVATRIPGLTPATDSPTSMAMPAAL